ncbi:hypothetical protein [Alcanivorax sp. IL2]|jgi:hypothetical protein|uniref:hypothetical protein n=1 Tax=Alcanivorax sp. IL2 TaxID=3396310 RepID=UPI0039C3796E
MGNVNAYLRENLPELSEARIYVAPNIEEKKLNNAIRAFEYEGEPNNVVGIIDNTLMGSGKEGVFFTGEKIVYKAAFSDPVHIKYSDINKVDLINVEKEEGRKQKFQISISHKGDALYIGNLISCDYVKLKAVLSHLVETFDVYEEEKQMVPMSEMGENVKVSYLKIIVNMAFDDDGMVDEVEFAEILLLITRLELSEKSRFELRSYMASIDNISPLDSLFKEMDEGLPSGQVHSVHISLAKDLLNLHFCTGGKGISDFAFLEKVRGLIKVSDEELELASMAIENDRKMLSENVTDDELAAAMKALSAKAAAVGVPLAAVYLSGSVVGMSAAGLTSGLATLGLGGVLGLSSMATGIGVAVLIGVGAYAGIRKLTGADEISKSKRREMMLTEVVKQTQKTISMLVEDANFITRKLNELLAQHGVQDRKIKHLVGLMSQLTSAGAVLSEKSNSAQGGIEKIHCAKIIDVDKLRSLTGEPSKKYLYDYILGFYEERMFVKEVEGEKKEFRKLVIKSDIERKDLENLSKAFEAIGYFHAGKILKGAATSAAGKMKKFGKGLFGEQA